MLEIVIQDSGSIKIGSRLVVSFQRTLRIPDDGRVYPLPPGLGVFPLLRVSDFSGHFPRQWCDRGDLFIPMYQREALWLGFSGAPWKPNAVKVSIGGWNALSGEAFDKTLQDDPQDYMVVPPQPWLDGINSGSGAIRQFVAMPLGLGYTVEASLTGEEKLGGLEIMVFEPKKGAFPDTPPAEPEFDAGKMPMRAMQPGSVQTMGLGAGGVMKQKIYADPYGAGVWDQENFGRVTIHILNSRQYREITGERPPPTPIDADTYTKSGLPWFDVYDETRAHVPPSEILGKVKTVAECDLDRETEQAGQTTIAIPETQIKKLHLKNGPKDGDDADSD